MAVKIGQEVVAGTQLTDFNGKLWLGKTCVSRPDDSNEKPLSEVTFNVSIRMVSLPAEAKEEDMLKGIGRNGAMR